MLMWTIGGVVVAGLLAAAGYRQGLRAAELGSMSEQWVGAYNASRPSSSG
jgi:hypothetical protein